MKQEQSSLNRPECDICDMGSCCDKRVADQKQKIREHIRESLILLSMDIDLRPKIEEYKEAILGDLDNYLERI